MGLVLARSDLAGIVVIGPEHRVVVRIAFLYVHKGIRPFCRNDVSVDSSLPLAVHHVAPAAVEASVFGTADPAVPQGDAAAKITDRAAVCASYQHIGMIQDQLRLIAAVGTHDAVVGLDVHLCQLQGQDYAAVDGVNSAAVALGAIQRQDTGSGDDGVRPGQDHVRGGGAEGGILQDLDPQTLDADVFNAELIRVAVTLDGQGGDSVEGENAVAQDVAAVFVGHLQASDLQGIAPDGLDGDVLVHGQDAVVQLVDIVGIARGQSPVRQGVLKDGRAADIQLIQMIVVDIESGQLAVFSQVQLRERIAVALEPGQLRIVGNIQLCQIVFKTVKPGQGRVGAHIQRGELIFLAGKDLEPGIFRDVQGAQLILVAEQLGQRGILPNVQGGEGVVRAVQPFQTGEILNAHQGSDVSAAAVHGNGASFGVAEDAVGVDVVFAAHEGTEFGVGKVCFVDGHAGGVGGRAQGGQQTQHQGQGQQKNRQLFQIFQFDSSFQSVFFDSAGADAGSFGRSDQSSLRKSEAA